MTSKAPGPVAARWPVPSVQSTPASFPILATGLAPPRADSVALLKPNRINTPLLPTRPAPVSAPLPLADFFQSDRQGLQPQPQNIPRQRIAARQIAGALRLYSLHNPRKLGEKKENQPVQLVLQPSLPLDRPFLLGLAQAPQFSRRPFRDFFGQKNRCSADCPSGTTTVKK